MSARRARKAGKVRKVDVLEAGRVIALAEAMVHTAGGRAP